MENPQLSLNLGNSQSDFEKACGRKHLTIKKMLDEFNSKGK